MKYGLIEKEFEPEVKPKEENTILYMCLTQKAVHKDATGGNKQQEGRGGRHHHQ